MNIYRIYQKHHPGANSCKYDSIVVVAIDEADALTIRPEPNAR